MQYALFHDDISALGLCGAVVLIICQAFLIHLPRSESQLEPLAVVASVQVLPQRYFAIHYIRLGGSWYKEGILA